jgi:hypothetical protein
VLPPRSSYVAPRNDMPEWDFVSGAPTKKSSRH